jgi:hypothetical protein
MSKTPHRCLLGRYQLLKTTPRRGGEVGVGVVDLLQVVFIVWPDVDLGWGSVATAW